MALLQLTGFCIRIISFQLRIVEVELLTKLETERQACSECQTVGLLSIDTKMLSCLEVTLPPISLLGCLFVCLMTRKRRDLALV